MKNREKEDKRQWNEHHFNLGYDYYRLPVLYGEKEIISHTIQSAC